MTKALESSRGSLRAGRGAWVGLVALAWAAAPAGAGPMRFAQDTPPAPPAPAQPAAPVPPPSAGTVSKQPESTGTPATVIDGQQVESLLGKQVKSATGEDMGHIADIIVDKSGSMRAAVIDFGGFLGVGSRRIAVDWSALRFPKDGKPDHVVVDIPRNELRVAPTYKEGEQVVVLGRPAAPQPPVTADPPPPAQAPAPAAK